MDCYFLRRGLNCSYKLFIPCQSHNLNTVLHALIGFYCTYKHSENKHVLSDPLAIKHLYFMRYKPEKISNDH